MSGIAQQQCWPPACTTTTRPCATPKQTMVNNFRLGKYQTAIIMEVGEDEHVIAIELDQLWDDDEIVPPPLTMR